MEGYESYEELKLKYAKLLEDHAHLVRIEREQSIWIKGLECERDDLKERVMEFEKHDKR